MRAAAILAAAVILAPLGTGAVGAGVMGTGLAGTGAAAQDVPLPERDGLTGLEWRFVRVRYTTPTDQLAEFLRIYGVDPWTVDAPVAEQNLSRRMARVTTIQVNEPIVAALTDDALWEQPWIYIVEPANMMLTDDEVANLREFLLRGGTVTFDDFHGPAEWELFARQMERVFPDRPIVDLGPGHAVFSSFYNLDAYPQIPGLGSFFNNVTWEKGGFEPKLRAILADDGRAMALINFNTDMGDGWEWSNAEQYPTYVQYTAQSYRMFINEIVYALTH
ncbi:MAG: DUF4159 domain-containing protein [Acidobacteria bacterium]|nr:DUF4159 domain-containing protein [Acidobacteriota bacterium]MYD70660.1 DUF4159 domain-containing protein [Acidobacteriota bacterium]MYJ03282.1 DUF4159 domain-containing protein [Acidobacteriota bacterium]